MALPISNLPVIAVLLSVAIASVLILMIALSRTKPATDETRVGKYEFILLPSGKRLSGILTLARKMVSEEWLHELVFGGAVDKEDAKLLQENFDSLFFYGLRSGHTKHFIVSPVNLEDHRFAKTTEEVFEFPFGYVAKRLVIGETVETQRAGWKVAVINPMDLKTGTNSETFQQMADIGAAAASVKEAAIRLKKDLPWKEIAKAREKQLKETQNKYAEAEHMIGEFRLGMAKPSLLEGPSREEGIPPAAPSGGFSWGRFITAFVGFVIGLYVVPIYFPTLDPFLPSLAVAAVVLWKYPDAKKILSRMF